MLNGLNNFFANRLSLKGDHAKALYVSDMKSIPVLSRAGMHLSVISSNPSSCVELALAYLHLGCLEDAYKVIEQLTLTKKDTALLGFLAVVSPIKCAETIKLFRNNEKRLSFLNIESYIAHKTKNDSFKDEKASKLHQLCHALSNKNELLATEYFNDFFKDFELNIPSFSFEKYGIKLSSLNNSSINIKEGGQLVSIVLAVYNESDYLHVAIDSLLNQSWKNIEIIVVNDGSTDCTLDAINSYIDRDPRIKLVDLPRNVGLWRAKNEGLLRATGEIITMHDADDWSHPEKIERQVLPLLKNSKLKATTSNFFRITEEDGIPYTRNACNYIRWNPSSFMFRKEVLEYMGNFIDGILGSDAEFIARLESNFGVASHYRVKLPLSIGFQRQLSLSNQHRATGLNSNTKRIEDWEWWRKLHLCKYKNKNSKMKYNDMHVNDFKEK